MIESYGVSKKNYRLMIEDSKLTASMIARKLTIPQKIYRYRLMGHDNINHMWTESPHWKDDINGICMFSTPDSFNKNDPNDCKVHFDTEKALAYMFKEYNRSDRRFFLKKGKPQIIDYKKRLQGTMRIGCFTELSPTCGDMWDDPNFGDKGRGICIEYSVDNSNFFPDNLAFLPILYDDTEYDNSIAMEAVIDYAKGNEDISTIQKMTCLGYGHTLIKPTKYEKEKEWRLVIPIRDDGVHDQYFDVDKKSKRDLSSAITAIYIGQHFRTLANSENYMDAIMNKWKQIPIYNITDEGIQPIKNA